MCDLEVTRKEKCWLGGAVLPGDQGASPGLPGTWVPLGQLGADPFCCWGARFLPGASPVHGHLSGLKISLGPGSPS